MRFLPNASRSIPGRAVRAGSVRRCCCRLIKRTAEGLDMPDGTQSEVTDKVTAEDTDGAFSGPVSSAQGVCKQGRTRTDTELEDALQDLREARDEAREEGFPEPSDTAIASAERLLRAMYVIAPQRFEIYPTPDGAIAVDAPGGYGRSFVVFCEATGGALCMLNLDDEHRSARYDATRTLPDGFVREALTELGQAVTRNR